MRGYSQMKNYRLLILALGAALIANADFSYTSTLKSAQAQAVPAAGPLSTKHFFKGQKMKMDNGDTATIIDFETQTITSFNHKQKTYSVTKFGDVSAAMPQDVEAKVDIQETGQKKTINGYNATEVVMTMEMDSPQSRQAGMKMQMEMTMWLSTDVPGVQELRAFYKTNGSRFPWAALGSGGNPGMQKAMADVQRKMAGMNGVPVLQVMKMKPAGDPAQMAQMQQGMAQMMAQLEQMKKQGGAQAAAAEQTLARMGGMAG